MLRPNDIIGPYELTRKLGSGSFGEVWLAKNIKAITAPPCAIKFAVSDEIDVEAVKREAEVWVLANGHPNVISIIEANVYNGHLVIVSEFARDGSLREWLRRHNGRAPSTAAAVEIMTGVLSGLEHLHAQRIIHRDLKPDNILIQGVTPRLADFGVSRVLKSSASTRGIAGTPVYMAPEAFKGGRTEQTDIWAAGAILYELLAGRFPFRQNDDVALMYSILNEPYEPLPSSAPQPLQAIIARALEKDPANRFQSAAEMRQALAKAIQSANELPTQSHPLPPPLPRITQPAPPPVSPAVTAPASERETIQRDPRIKADVNANRQALPPASKRGKLIAAGGGLIVVIALWIAASSGWLNSGNPSTTTTTPGITVKPAPALQSFIEDLGNGVTLEMVGLRGGTFEMGSPDGRGSDGEHPQHSVTVSPFNIGKYEVTQAQWKAVMGSNNNLSYFKGDNLPVEWVSWNGAVEFCKKLSDRTGRKYRLPTETEWEYAARAGSKGKYSFGDDENRLGEYAWFDKNSGSTTHPAGQKRPNDWGLYDMHGNVWEWVQDWYDNNYYRQSVNSIDPQGPPSGDYRGLRGGSWRAYGYNCRSASRNSDRPDLDHVNSGLRVVVVARTS